MGKSQGEGIGTIGGVDIVSLCQDIAKLLAGTVPKIPAMT
jgi:hypothetical protein